METKFNPIWLSLLAPQVPRTDEIPKVPIDSLLCRPLCQSTLEVQLFLKHVRQLLDIILSSSVITIRVGETNIDWRCCFMDWVGICSWTDSVIYPHFWENPDRGEHCRSWKKNHQKTVFLGETLSVKPVVLYIKVNKLHIWLVCLKWLIF